MVRRSDRDDPRLRGRVPEQAVLADLIAGNGDGTADVVLINGPGIGESRLAHDAARLAAGRGFLVAAARSNELDQVTITRSSPRRTKQASDLLCYHFTKR